jgi:hypothetical protein
MLFFDLWKVINGDETLGVNENDFKYICEAILGFSELSKENKEMRMDKETLKRFQVQFIQFARNWQEHWIEITRKIAQPEQFPFKPEISEKSAKLAHS